MADFEALIRDALAKQDASNPGVRKKVYQSSRNALERMIARAENVVPQAAAKQRQALEESIGRIEADHAGSGSPEGQGYAPRKVVEPVPHPSAVRAAGQKPVAASTPQPRAEQPPLQKPVQAQTRPNVQAPEAAARNAQSNVAPPVQPGRGTPPPPITPVPPVPPVANMNPQQRPMANPPDEFSARLEPTLASDEGLGESRNSGDMGLDSVELVDHATYEQYADGDFSAPPPELRRKRRWPLRWLVTLIFIVLFFAFGYYMYSFVMNFVREYNANPPKKEELSGGQSKGLKYINILQPQDTSGLVVADRGIAEIVDLGGDKKVIQIQSVRQENNKNKLAKPMLIELKPGVLKDIAGKEVTVEIQAKSGGTEHAQFSVECHFTNQTESDCDRKRFRVGLQPEAVVFKVKVSQAVASEEAAYLAINTDITKAANVSGEGQLLDIYDARISLPKE